MKAVLKSPKDMVVPNFWQLILHTLLFITGHCVPL